MRVDPRYIAALVIILVLFMLVGCNTITGEPCSSTYTDPELVQMCEALKLSEQRAAWELQNRQHLQHGAGGCTPNHSTGGCL